MRKIEVSSTSVDKAIEKGLMLLETTREQVEVKVLEENSMLKKFKIEMVMFETEEERQEYEEQNKPKVETTKKAKREHKYDAELSQKVIEVVKEFLNGYLTVCNLKFELKVVEEDKDVKAYINGEDMGGLIGHHGEAMENLQYLLNLFVKAYYPDYDRKVYIDIENYKAKRESTVIDLANRLAYKVVKNRSSMKLEPMSAYERRIIHNALSNKANISTHSEGEEPNRYLVIDYVE